MLIGIVACSLLVAGCGRIEFGEVVAADAGLLGHDEDGDGITDALDPCPHVGGDAADADGDGVGDACDPAPAIGGERFRVFSTLQAGDHPFTSIDEVAQQDDSLRFAGASLSLRIPLALAKARIELGFEIRALIGAGQHQVASGVENASPTYYFVELNDLLSGETVAVVSFDTINGYVALDSEPHGGVHPGVGILRYDVATSPPSFSVVAGWTGELYSAAAATPAFVGGSEIRVVLNGLDVELRYVVVIDRP